MKYVNKKMIIVINRLVTQITGGTAASGTNIRQGQSLGFVERIFNNEVFAKVLYPDIYHQAAAYMFYVIKNHVFLDGNKRTGLAAAVTFLKWNNILFAPFEEDKVFDFVMDVSAGANDPESVIPRIALWLKELSLY
ncbi:MAG: type II toxin-antitoxin system death-on-curing family toxin [Spirochaetales bacterium]|nr:type II toxin-antitoxin system death-on-curing family toxin [Spirochaetales bacterium]